MSDLIPKHGGYRKLKGFQVAQLAYDITVRFVEKYVDRFSRTKDQMVQAARSGVQNIAEGSQASATSKKTELKLTQVARASLEELRLDYEDFLRQKNLPLLEPGDPVLVRFKQRRPQSLDAFRLWVKSECERQEENTDGHGLTRTGADRHGPTRTGADAGGVRPGHSRTDKDGADGHGPTRTEMNVDRRAGSFAGGQPSLSVSSLPVRERPCKPQLPPECLVANGALSLLNLACWFLDRQVEQLAINFENEGGFTERLYKVRSEKRRRL